MKVAWIGLGRIGKQMALKILSAGYSLVGHARTPEKQPEIIAAGGEITTSIIDAISQAKLVFVNVYDELQLREVIIDSGALNTMIKDSILIIHSTVGPAIIKEIANLCKDIQVLDAAFSGTDKSAINGTITLMIGGDINAIEIAKPLLSTYANNIIHTGENGTGMTIKFINNALFGAQMLLARDALTLLEISGMKKELAVDVLMKSSGGSFAISLFGEGTDIKTRVESAWPYMVKDVGLANKAAEEMGYDLGMIATATLPFIKNE